jgi:hypothetical protein
LNNVMHRQTTALQRRNGYPQRVEDLLVPTPTRHRSRVAVLVVFAVGVVLCGVALTGCTTGAQTATPHRAPVPQHEIDSRTAARVARANPDAADTTSSATKSMSPPLRKAMASYRIVLRNAAARDREMEGLIRRYLGLTREVFHHFRAGRPTPSGGPGTYDPLPTWRFQAQQSFNYRLLGARAALVQEHLKGIAAQQQIDLESQGKGRGRGERVALYARIFACIQGDAMSRADHGRKYIAQGGRPLPRMPPVARATLYQSELAMMRRSVTCTSLTALRRPRMIGQR